MYQSLEEYGWYQNVDNPGRQIISRAIQKVDNSYGGINTDPIYPYYYHNGIHTRMALEDLAVLRDVLGLTDHEFVIAQTAMASHDIIKTFNRPSGLDEQESAIWYEKEMKKVPYLSRAAIEIGKLAILGTTPRFSNGTIIQKAVEQDYPNKRSKLVSYSVAGADVGRLFTKDGPYLAHMLYKENNASSGKEPESLVDLKEFQESQIEFLLNYKYPNREIELAMATHKSKIIRYLGQLSSKLERGDIATWKNLMDEDDNFVKSFED